MVFWTFFIGISYSLNRIDQIVLCLKIGYIGGFLYSPVILHFYLAISKTEIKPYYLILNYFPSVILMISNWIDFFIFSSIIKNNNEWLGILNAGSIRMYFYITVLVITFIFTLIILVKWYFNTKSNKEKIQARLILVFFSISYFTCFTLTLILPLFGIYKFQFPGVVIFDMYIIGLYFLISRYRFMNLTGASTASELISNINELVFILDSNLKITDISSSAERLFHYSGENIRNRFFPDIILNYKELNGGLKSISNGDNNILTLINYKTGLGSFPARTNISGIKDRFNDHSGFLIISSAIKDIERFQKNYRITKRELEVTGLIISGFSYKEISDKLLISERTVERHLSNIYNKLGISNKIELYRIAGEYNFKL